MQEDKQRITVAEAARVMGKSLQFIRIGLQRGLLPFGVALETKKGRFSYYISPSKFSEFTGIPMEELNRYKSRIQRKERA